jgi:hypothetical protein
VGTVVNLGRGGAGVLVPRTPPGQLVTLDLLHDPARSARPQAARVTHVRPSPGGLIVGGDFDPPLGDADLAALLA